MACAICKTRREKRYCPGVHGNICAICCGEQREETIDCPLDCEYLQRAHEHEGRLAKDPAGMPAPEFRMTGDFLRKNMDLIIAVQRAVLTGAVRRNAGDSDAKEALTGLVRTYQTLESGLYYESRPANPIAGAIFDAVQEHVAEVRKLEDERGMHKTTDGQVRSVLLFLQQMEYAYSNDRKRSRGFLDWLRTAVAEIGEMRQSDPASLIVS